PRRCRTGRGRRSGCSFWRWRWQDGSCRFRSDQRHDAGCLTIEVRVFYPFHPRCGEIVVAVGRKRHAGIDHLIIRQRDSTLTLLPAWMTEPGSSSFGVLEKPRLPLERLFDLRARLDALLTSSSEESPRRGGIQHENRTPPPAGSVRNPQATAGDDARAASESHRASSSASDRGRN